VYRQIETVPATRELLDERFADFRGDRHLERIFRGGRWTEGPVYSPGWRCLLFSDIPNDRLLRWDETTDQVGVFRQPSGYANGHTRDRAGRLVSCEHGNRRVTRTEHDGTVTVIADRYQGKRLNSPNDVVEHSDGSIWFTDPAYGIDTDYEGHRAESEIGACHVYRIDPDTGACEIVADDFERPNGLAFSLDERVLYIADSQVRHIRVFGVENGRLSGGELFADCPLGVDGMRLDATGRIWVAAHDGLHCLAADGTLIGKLLVPETVANLTFGGPKRNRLYITATTSVYSYVCTVNGAPQPFDR
jgi:gluconolactonase